MKPVLKKHLLQVFLSAVMYNPGATLQYLDEKQLTKDIIVGIINIKREFRSQYERKMFILGLTSLLSVPAAPPNITDPNTMAKFIQECLVMLDKVQKKESSKAKKKAQKQIHADSSSDGEDESSYDDSDDESSEDEAVRDKTNIVTGDGEMEKDAKEPNVQEVEMTDTQDLAKIGEKLFASEDEDSDDNEVSQSLERTDA